MTEKNTYLGDQSPQEESNTEAGAKKDESSKKDQPSLQFRFSKKDTLAGTVESRWETDTFAVSADRAGMLLSGKGILITSIPELEQLVKHIGKAWEYHLESKPKIVRATDPHTAYQAQMELPLDK